MTKAIPFGDWLDEQGDDVRLAMCEGHPETLILVDTTNMGVYKYVVAESQDGVREATSEFLRKRMHELGSEVDQMERFNVPIPYGEDFPQVIRAQRNGEDFQTEYVEYVPQWNVDKRRQAVIVDERVFFALTGTVDRLQEYSAKVTELARWMYQVMDESCATHYPYEPTPVSIHALMRAEQKLRALGIEV